MKNNIHTFIVLAYKESEYLEECIKSVMNQKYKSNVIIATTTNNNYIKNIAKKYKLNIITGKHTTIGGDFDFAINSSNTELVTIAHQDDIYEYEYSKKIVDNYNKYKESTIIFTDYYEIKNNKKIYSNINLKIKRILLFPLKFKWLSKYKFWKSWVIRFGNAICCPSVTFIKKNCPKKIFTSNYLCNVDWNAWEKLSKIKGNFIYINKKLMGHRITENSTTTNIIKKGIRTKEDYAIYTKFWPKPIAKILTHIYKKSEKSNELGEEK